MIMHGIDALHLEYPFAGSRMLRDLLRAEGVVVGRLAVATRMRRTGDGLPPCATPRHRQCMRGEFQPPVPRRVPARTSFRQCVCRA